jgi:hypothetical protein
MIPQDRSLYLELAKQRPNDKRWVRTCFKNYARVLKREWAAVGGPPMSVAY